MLIGPHRFRELRTNDMSTPLINFLRVVQKNSDLETLIRDGLRYSQIAVLAELAEREGYIRYNDDERLSLTTKGEALLVNFSGPTLGDRSWVRPLDAERVEKLDSAAAYVPTISAIKALKRTLR
jgi:hypothetical protein